MTVYVAYQQASTYAAAADRKLLSPEMLVTDKAGTARGGVISGNDDFALKAYMVSGLTTYVYSGAAMVPPDYRVMCDSNMTVTHNAGGASARTDLIILRVYETESGDASNKGQIEIVQGTTTADPAVPARSIVLAAVAISAGAASITIANVTDRRVFTTGAGGIVKQASPVAADFGAGQLIYDSAADKVMVKGPSILRSLEFTVERYGTPIFGTWPADMSQVRIRPFYASLTTDGFGTFSIPSGFTQCLGMATCVPTRSDTDGVMFTPFTSRLGGGLAAPGFWALDKAGNAKPNTATYVNGMFIGC